MNYRVIANFGARIAVAGDEPHQLHQALPSRQLPLIVAGDRVRCELQAETRRITGLLDRTSVLERGDRLGRPRALAANLTHLAIVSADPPGIDTRLIDQFCLAAHRAGVDALVLINKSDRLDDDARTHVQSLLDVYAAVGYPTVLMNTRTAEGLDPLHQAVAGRVLALVGASGVGKSSIVKQLLPDRDIRIGEVSAATGLGAHTTSVTCWYDLPGDGALIDSPGVREYSVAHLQADDVRRGYIEIDRTAHNCRFTDCWHDAEPDCAVRDAVARGEIAEWRYANYRTLCAAAKEGGRRS